MIFRRIVYSYAKSRKKSKCRHFCERLGVPEVRHIWGFWGVPTTLRNENGDHQLPALSYDGDLIEKPFYFRDTNLEKVKYFVF
jgi:hypothetical protein